MTSRRPIGSSEDSLIYDSQTARKYKKNTTNRWKLLNFN
jgi:hypothetical protein